MPSFAQSWKKFENRRKKTLTRRYVSYIIMDEIYQ